MKNEVREAGGGGVERKGVYDSAQGTPFIPFCLIVSRRYYNVLRGERKRLFKFIKENRV
jgi:hypothetical protein